MEPQRDAFPEPLAWLIMLFLAAFCVLCVWPYLDHAYREVQRWRATPTPTPVALVLETPAGDESAGREAYYAWLRQEQGLEATADPELEDRAYYLAGEAPRLRRFQTWPQWYGLRYVVGPAAGNWVWYWPGSTQCSIFAPRGSSLATYSPPDMAAAQRVGAAVAWREEQPYLAVVWPGTCTPAPTPAFVGAGAEGPGW